MKNKILDHIDLWLRMLLRHFDKHRVQGIIFFAEIGLSIILWSVIIVLHIINN